MNSIFAKNQPFIVEANIFYSTDPPMFKHGKHGLNYFMSNERQKVRNTTGN